MSEENSVTEDTARELAEFEKDKLRFLKTSRIVSFLICMLGAGLVLYGLYILGVIAYLVAKHSGPIMYDGIAKTITISVFMAALGVLFMYLGRWFSLYSRIFIRQRR